VHGDFADAIVAVHRPTRVASIEARVPELELARPVSVGVSETPVPKADRPPTLG
jgi:hypothetical protein